MRSHFRTVGSSKKLKGGDEMKKKSNKGMRSDDVTRSWLTTSRTLDTHKAKSKCEQTLELLTSAG